MKLDFISPGTNISHNFISLSSPNFLFKRVIKANAIRPIRVAECKLASIFPSRADREGNRGKSGGGEEAGRQGGKGLYGDETGRKPGG